MTVDMEYLNSSWMVSWTATVRTDAGMCHGVCNPYKVTAVRTRCGSIIVNNASPAIGIEEYIYH